MNAYPSKLLLFGEYVLLLGSSALALPMPAYRGNWSKNAEEPNREFQKKLLQFADSEKLAHVKGLDLEAFRFDLQNGLVFESNIPIGYGLGSSGALCAGVYKRYCRQKTGELGALKEIFAGMESFFHGSSSGIDPLTSYIGKPLLIRQKTEVSIAELSLWQQPPIVFLMDSGLARHTAPLVRWFVEKMEQPEFAEILRQAYLPVHEATLESWMKADADFFWTNLHRVSQFQWDNFEPMIPTTIRTVWAENLQSQQVIFKICGAGGGGFMLGFSKTIEPVQVLAKDFQIIFPFTATP